MTRCVIGRGRRAVVWRGVDVEEGGRPGQIGPKEWAVVVPVPSGAVRAAASAGRKSVVDQLAVGVEVASCTEGTIAAVGRERRRLRGGTSNVFGTASTTWALATWKLENMRSSSAPCVSGSVARRLAARVRRTPRAGAICSVGRRGWLVRRVAGGRRRATSASCSILAWFLPANA